MRYPFQVIKEWQIPLTPLPKTYPATAAFLELMVTLDELFDEFPAVLRLPEGTALTLLYRDVVYSDQDILNSVGGLACHISETCSLTFYGTTEHRETAEMTVRPGSSPKKGRVLTRSLSGRPIRRLQGLGVRLDLGDRDAADHLTVMARALAASGGPWGVVSRQHEAFVHKCGLLQPTQGSLFSYFAWENARPQQLLTALTAEHKALLWESFLADGQQPLEFAWLWEIYYTGFWSGSWPWTWCWTSCPFRSTGIPTASASWTERGGSGGLTSPEADRRKSSFSSCSFPWTPADRSKTKDDRKRPGHTIPHGFEPRAFCCPVKDSGISAHPGWPPG